MAYEKTPAYVEGQKAAAQQYDIESQPGQADDGFYAAKKKKRSWLPAAAVGGLGALAAYKYLRTPSFSSNPALAAIQARGATQGFHRVTDVQDRGPGLGAGIFKRLYYKTIPHVNEKGELDALNKAKLWFHEGSEAIPVTQADTTNRPYVPGAPDGVDVKGYVYGRSVGPNAGTRSNPVRGGSDIEGPLSTQKATSYLSRKGKGLEADLLTKHAPDAIPRSYSDLSSSIPRGAPSVEGAKLFQKDLTERMQGTGVSDFALKPTQGFASGGVFPRASENWGEHYEKFQRHMAVPSNAQQYRQLLRNDVSSELPNYLRHYDIERGAAIHQALKNPSSVMAQEWLPDALGEYRVHTVEGTAPSHLIMSRHPRTSLSGAASGVRNKDVQQFVEQDVLAKLPEKYRRGSYGMDVMPFRKADGSVEFKVLEMNPHERGTVNSTGADSGLLMPSIRPGSGWRHYRAMTGRHAEPVAAMGALGAGVGASALARKLTPESDDDGPGATQWP